MARLKTNQIIHSTDAVKIVLEGNPQNPEPATVVVETPFGHVEVSRCSTGEYWLHVSLTTHPEDGEFTGQIVDGRIDYQHGAAKDVTDLPEAELLRGLSIKVGKV